jgi:hypothetical protein
MHESSFASGGYRAKHFIEAAGLQLQLFELQVLAGRKLADLREDLRAGLRQSRQARIAFADFNRCNERQRGDRRARRLEILPTLELQ